MDPTLKQRLVGTAVLIALAVIFVPMILDGPVDQPTPPRTTGVPLALPEPAELQPEPAPQPQPQPQVQVQVQVPTPTPATIDAGWAIQLGAFSDNDRAGVLADRVKALGFDAFVQRAVLDNGTMYRVRIGPLADRAAADALATRVQRATGERAVVVSHP